MSVPNFPHLLPAERFIWANFLMKYGRIYDAFEYDVRLGQGHPVDPTYPDYIQNMARRLSKKRVDAVGYQGGLPTIFEVAPRGGRTTIGALQLYQFLWREERASTPQPQLAAVVGRCDPDCLRYFQATGVSLYIMPALAAVG